MQLQRIIRLLLSLLILASLLIDASGLFHYPFLQKLENWTYDSRLNFTRPDTIDTQVVIVDIDEISLTKVGRFPWKRDQLANLVNNLFDHYQIKTLGFDIVFAEQDTSSGLNAFTKLAQNELKDDQIYLKTLEKLRPSLEYDELFGKSLENKDVVLGYYFKSRVEQGDDEKIGQLPKAITEMTDEWTQRLPIYKAEGFGANLAVLQTSAKSGGYFDNPSVDNDGVFRRVPLIQSYNNQLYSSLALSTASLALDSPNFELIVETDGKKDGRDYYALEAINLGKYRIPVDHNGAVYVPYRGKTGSFPYVSAYKVLNKTADPAVLKNKIVLLGTSAPGLLDLRSTPVENIYPGVEVHANIISGILNQTIKHKPAWSIGYEFLLLILTAAAMFLVLIFLPPILAALSSLIITAIVVAGTLLAWQNSLILPLASPLLLIALLFTLHMTYGFFIESRGKRQLAHMFGQYIPPELVDEMSETATEFSLEGESREMTVLFSDVRGFTTISEGLNPKQLTQLMNALLTPMTRMIHKNRGTIDKYMGDAIMAFWGAPLQDPEHARHALYAAFDMMKELKVMQQEFREKGWPEVNIGIGLNTGVMNVGNMGSEFRVAYTVLGDAVNLGSRLEGLTKAYGVNIIVSETTKAAVDEFVFRELDLVRVKGKNEPVAIFEPIGHKNDVSKEVISELSRYKQALMVFRQQNWDKAEMDFFNLSQSYPDCKLYTEYLDRINAFRQNSPGEDWDGVFTHTSK
ncbi:MAG: adenylate/guanylate cyclase domain-containing protein [Gammaproteobacteria bacterium]|nr:adenylate/guanylate cyclase domain-containing protein [Gammaproteobacteria bacterium]MBL6999531.1 adenylate/guanylate cyclase domain-containing protein [Gammaproteobacteria bacterium]